MVQNSFPSCGVCCWLRSDERPICPVAETDKLQALLNAAAMRRLWRCWNASMITLKADIFENLDGTPAGLQRALQFAIELEHSTIPPYLYALYSLRPNGNDEIAELIKSVVVQEMLHLSIACNILNSIGGIPRIDDPAFVPKYPGHLPGGVEGSLVVGLEPFSKQVVLDTFMVIEEPEDPLHFPVLEMEAAVKPKTTIGQFYEAIIKQIQDLGNRIFIGDPKQQLTTGFSPLRTMCIHSVESASEAIKLIVSQGEGTKKSPLASEGEPAHYYRFAEVYYGKKLIPNPDISPGTPDYVYGGHSIEFNPADVWPVIANPNSNSYERGTKAFNLNLAFNQTYTELLMNLQRIFSGEPDRLGPAITLMESMQEQAVVLMSTEVVPGQTAGPTFEFNPDNG